MREINRMIQRFRKAVAGGRSDPVDNTLEDLPLDHQLTFTRGAAERWSFKEGRILLNGQDVEEMIDSSRNDVRFQSAVSEAVSEYQDFVWKRGCDSYDKFLTRADSIQDKILFNMKRIYDEKTGGVRFGYGQGGFLLNNINIRAIIALYQIRPTEKARRFLCGLKAKLNLILANKNGSPNFDRINNVIRSLCNEVDDALNNTPPDAHYLPLDNGHSGV